MPKVKEPMHIILNPKNIKKKFKNPVMAIGVFDGLHCGHRHLIKRMLNRARTLNGTSVVVTFYPHPLHVMRPKHNLALLVSLEHRLRLIEECGVDVCIVVKFTKKFSHLTPERFIKEYITDMVNPREVFIGSNFRFGKNRLGTIDMLKQFALKGGFEVTAVAPREKDKKIISSTRIRRLIIDGDIYSASRLLGQPVSIFGKVQKGHGVGKKLGYPTANINPVEEIIPPCGIYAARVFLNHKPLPAMAYIGRRPSFEKQNSAIMVEAYILNFHKNIYGKNIEVQFIKKIRDDKIFSTRAQLIDRIKKDEHIARLIFSRYK